ncbi:Hypothetical protein FKW44_002090, partial [Caligus rogercresseyi]
DSIQSNPVYLHLVDVPLTKEEFALAKKDVPLAMEGLALGDEDFFPSRIHTSR